MGKLTENYLLSLAMFMLKEKKVGLLMYAPTVDAKC
jgi:hypothetical protein